MKKRKFNNLDQDDEGIDVDTFEANYVPDYEDEDNDGKSRDNYQRGGRRGGYRGQNNYRGSGGQRGGRGYGYGGRGGNRDGGRK